VRYFSTVYQERNENTMATKIPALFLFLFLTNALNAQDKHLIDSLYRSFHGERDAKKKIDLLYDIANEQDDAGNPDDGFRYADSLQALSKAARYERGQALALDIRGAAYARKGEHTTALPFFHQQLAIFNQIKDLKGQARALSNIGSSWQELSVNDSAITYFLRALDIKERLGNKTELAASLSNIANIYEDEHAYDKGIELLHRALRIRRELGEEKKSMFTLNNLAVAYGLKGDFEKSVAYADTGIATALKYNNKMVAGVICGGMSHVLNEQKRFAESISWCERSMNYLKEAKREANMVFPLCNMATAYIGLGQYVKGLEINQQGWEIMQRLKLIQPLDPYHENFANAYAGLNDFENAYKWHKIYYSRIDSVNNVDNTSKVANIEAKYGLEKKERELSEQRADNFRQRVALFSLLATLLAALLLGYLFYNRFRLRKKAELDAAIIREQKLGLNAVIEAQEAERKRIARDLHDGIAQELVALKLGFDALGRRVSKIAPDESPKLAALGEQLDSSCTEVRSIAHVMSPPVLEQQGLAPSLEILLQHMLQYAGLEARLNAHDLPLQMDEKIEIGLYRITQELLNNIVKHAGAAKVLIELYSQGPNLVLRVEDDGVGYDFEEARARGSMGLLNILSRATALGGVFNTEKKKPHGTVALVRVPI